MYELYGLTDAEIAAVEGRSEAPDSTDTTQSESQVIPHHSGYAPGVDPNNLKGILYEEDIERYRRVSAQ